MDTLIVKDVKILTLFVMAVLVLMNAVSVPDFERFEAGKCRMGQYDIMLWGRTYIDCLRECKSRIDCKAISMKVKLHSCRLNMGDESVTDCVGYVFSNKQNWIEKLLPECVEENCKQGQKCIIDKSTGIACCIIQECTRKSDPPYGSIIGNDLQVGSSISFVCREGFHLKNTGISQTCMVTKTWSGEQPICITVSEHSCYDPQFDTQSYSGTINRTWSGLPCQMWRHQSPHKHKLWDLQNNENYCRNPDDTRCIWCYTVDPAIRWQCCCPP